MSQLWGGVRPFAALVCGLFRDFAVRSTKIAIRDALASDDGVAALVPGSQIFSVERATIPALPSIEIIAITSERVDTGPMVKHELSVECTVSHSDENGADSALDAIVAAVRGRLLDAEHLTRPIALVSGEGVLVVV